MSLMGMCSWAAVSSLKGLVRRGIWTLDACFRAFLVSFRGGAGRFTTLGARAFGLAEVPLLSALSVDEGEPARVWFGYWQENVTLGFVSHQNPRIYLPDCSTRQRAEPPHVREGIGMSEGIDAVL